MKDRASAIDAHAYVDNCLPPAERKAFEARLRQDDELRRRVDLWQTQSDAIRVAFGASAGEPRAAGPQPKPAAPNRKEATEPALRLISRAPAAERGAPKWMSFVRRPITRAAILLAALTFFPGVTGRTPAALAETGASAFRAFSPAPASKLDFHGGSSFDLARELGPRFVAAHLPEWATPLGWTLRGAKRVPGLHGEAILIILEGKENRPLGVLIEPLDAPASSAISTKSLGGLTVAAFTRRGFGFAVAGPAEDGVEAWLSASGFDDDGWPQPAR